MEFDAMIDSLKAGEAPETIYDDLSLAYSTMLESSSAKVSELEASAAAAAEAHAADIQARDAEISRLKAVNYDLLMATPSADPEDGGSEPDSEEDDGQMSIDDLFES